MNLMRLDIAKANNSQLMVMESEATFIAESISNGIEGLGHLLQASKPKDVTEETFNHVGQLLVTLGYMMNDVCLKKDIIHYRLNEDDNEIA